MARILAVDDQPANLRLINAVLAPTGVEVSEARSGAEALATAQETTPDLILLDMHLPDMHGLEVLRLIRQSAWGAGLRVVAMSAYASPEDHALWRKAGCLATVEKPFTVTTFREDVSRWLSGSTPAEEATRPDAAPKKDTLGDILLAYSLITPEQLRTAMTGQPATGRRLGQLLVEQRAVSEDDIAWALSNQLGYPYIFLTREIIDDEAVRLLPDSFLRERRVLPILKSGQELRLAMADPTDQATVDEVGRRTGLQVKRALALISNIEEMLDQFSLTREPHGQAEVTTEAQYLQFHLVQALHQGASELHFDPGIDGQGRVRYRLQHVLVDRAYLPAELHAGILRHLRDLTRAGDAPVRVASATTMIGDVEARLVVTFLPTTAGAAGVISLHPIRTEAPDLAQMEVGSQSIAALRSALGLSRGVIVVGCGDPLLRSTLLHALVPLAPRGKVWTLETLPVYRRPTLHQTAVDRPDEVAGLLREVAGAGADLIVVDDVLDREALVAACETGRRRALLAGHPEDDVVDLLGVVLEAAGPALASATVRGIVAARAVRVLCPACKEPLSQSTAGAGGPVVFIARGCDVCGFTGFRGSRTLAQVWVPGPDSRRLLRLGPSQALFERVASEAGPSLREQGRLLIEDGLTSPDELSRVVDGH